MIDRRLRVVPVMVGRESESVGFGHSLGSGASISTTSPYSSSLSSIHRDRRHAIGSSANGLLKGSSMTVGGGGDLVTVAKWGDDGGVSST